jgi:Papain family cysteine protease
MLQRTPSSKLAAAAGLAILLAGLTLGASLPANLAHAALSADAVDQNHLGYVPDLTATSTALMSLPLDSALPAAVDLSASDPPLSPHQVGNSCVAWATGYYLRGWYAERDGYYPASSSGGSGGYEPMYTYAQIDKGANVGSTFAENLTIQQTQGIDTRADYTQGDGDYTDQPTTAETVNAATMKIGSYTVVSNGGGTSLETWIKNTMASGNPVAIGIPVYPEFKNVGSGTGYVVYPPTAGETSSGNHAIFGSKYDAMGLRITNSWGLGFGDNGHAWLSWSFINQYGRYAASIVPAGNGLASGYAWANNPTSSSYTPNPAYQYNSSGATNTISRSGVGSYTVAFPNLGVNGGTALVTAYGLAATCEVTNWLPVGTAQDVDVRCFNSSGAPVNTAFTVAFAHPQSTANALAFLWANQPNVTSYTPNLAYQFNSSGAANTITRLGIGTYAVLLPNLGGTFGHVQVTAYGSVGERCVVVNWGLSGTAQQVKVNCFSSAGAALDSMFTLTYVRGRAIDGGPAVSNAHLWADQPSAGSYTPNMNYQYNSSGAANTITRLGTGSYTVSLPGQNLNVGDVQLTAYGSHADACMVAGWAPTSGVVVNCFDSTGGAADTDFDLSFVNA